MQPRHHDAITRIAKALPDLYPRLNSDTLTILLEELLEWNPQLGLISRRSTPDVLARLIRQSVSMWDFIAEKTIFEEGLAWRVADVGTGGGFPGLVWKALVPSLHMTLVERKTRRALFLERVVHRLSAPDIDVLEVDLKELARHPGRRQAFDLAVALAVAVPERLAKGLERILKAGGYFATVRTTGETTVPSRLGSSLRLQSKGVTDAGTYLIYRSS